MSSPRTKCPKSQKKHVRQASKLVPVAFVRLGGASNHAPVHFVKSPVAQAHGLEHPKSSRARQARSLNQSQVSFELLVRGLCSIALQRKMAAQSYGGEKSEHSSHETYKNASGAPPELLQTTCPLCFRASCVLQTTYLCIRRNQGMHRYVVWERPGGPGVRQARRGRSRR